MLSRYLRRAVLSITATTIVIGQQILLAKTATAQTQENLPPVAPLQWVGYSGRSFANYPDAITACEQEYEILLPEDDDGYSFILQDIEFYEYPGYVQSAKCLMQWEGGAKDVRYVDASCPDTYIYSGGTFGVCVLPSEYEKIKPYLDKLLPPLENSKCKNTKDSPIPCNLRKYAETALPYILVEALNAGATDAQIAYILATAQGETDLGRSIREKSDKGIKAEDYFKQKYWDNVELRQDLGNIEEGDAEKYKGRGYEQVTGRGNYEKFSDRLGLDLINNPDLLTKPEYAAKAIVAGMLEGIYTGLKKKDGTYSGKKLATYVNQQKQDFRNARRIINGTDRADDFTKYAEKYAKALGDVK
jgi:hypothetical protein